MSELKLPQGWVSCKFTDLLDIQGGTQPPKSEFISSPQDGYIRLLQIRDFGKKPIPTYIPDTKKIKKCEKMDLLIGRYGASLGKICSGMDGAYNVALAKVISSPKIKKSFLKKYLESELFQAPLRLLSRSAQNGFNKEDLSTFDFLLIPEKEQAILAEKLDTLLPQVDSIKARLEKIPLIIKKFRQSVLVAAVSGKLTEANLISSEKIDDISDVIGGLTKNANRNDFSLKLPLLKVANVYENNIRVEDIAEIGILEKEIERVSLKKDDILVVEGNGSIEQIGRAAIWNEEIKNCIHQNHLIKIRSYTNKVVPKFVLYYFMSPQGKSEIIKKATSGAGLYTLSISKISSISIPLYSIEEQAEIVRRVEQLFAYADGVEKQVQSALERVNNLTQSILAKAFRGELTAQWREENPELISGENSAEALLARIKAERAAQQPQKKTRRKANAAG
ncbi:restriction endonuclease subunit S [Dickeya sp. ws52]|uniref:restriction endonuclease subunit S n=1 Tax=Dickeya sp. ws52 TaxID=2576377 RepID=UPI00117CD529|nr:restriction endonuclease subunit S [Dickeya sp. ws52]TYL42987.1 type I restriction endonuclease subunit S [Dickeya sp. ws52]